MPRLRKRQHEEFCQAYVARPNAGAAALTAGYEHANRYTQGYRLLRRPEIAARILELREEMAARECLSLGVLLAKLESAFSAAVQDGDAHAAVRVIELQAKLTGHLAPRARPAPADAPADAEDTATAAAEDEISGTIVADPNRFAAVPAPSGETLRAALEAVARASARKRARRRSG